MAIFIKTSDELVLMRRSGRIVAEILQILRERVKPGISTGELDEIALREARRRNAEPSFLGYHGYPGSICASVNQEVVHGIPSRKRILREGDIVSLDFGASHLGYHGDSAITVPVGRVSPEAQRLLDATQSALRLAMAQARAGRRLGDVSHAVESYAAERGLGIAQGFCGHGVGYTMHEDPEVPNRGQPGRGVPLKTGMTFAIEPMLTLGTSETVTLPDGWTAETADGSLAAHFEHTVAVGPEGPIILTEL